MQLYQIRGGNKNNLEQKKYTIGVGISLGNKWFTVENIVESIKWALPYSKDKIIVYVADSIHAINLEVRNSISFEKALLLCRKASKELFAELKATIDKDFSDEQVSRILFVTWDELIDNEFKKKLVYLDSLYENNQAFKDKILSVVKAHISKESRKFSEEDIHRFGQYIIAEMPEVLNRVPMKGVICDAYMYPYDNELTKFAEQLQKGEIFPEIKEHVIDTEPKVFWR
jgi:tRNA-dependent cyclodipeptide synthase